MRACCRRWRGARGSRSRCGSRSALCTVRRWRVLARAHAHAHVHVHARRAAGARGCCPSCEAPTVRLLWLLCAALACAWRARAGVLNTDNMSILGVTIDYGPYGFMDACVCVCVCVLRCLLGACMHAAARPFAGPVLPPEVCVASSVKEGCRPSPANASRLPPPPLPAGLTRATHPTPQTSRGAATATRTSLAQHSACCVRGVGWGRGAGAAAHLGLLALNSPLHVPRCRCCRWNCVQLANALFAADLVGKEQAEAALEAYAEVCVCVCVCAALPRAHLSRNSFAGAALPRAHLAADALMPPHTRTNARAPAVARA
jgi:hypothetical protein